MNKSITRVLISAGFCGIRSVAPLAVKVYESKRQPGTRIFDTTTIPGVKGLPDQLRTYSKPAAQRLIDALREEYPDLK